MVTGGQNCQFGTRPTDCLEGIMPVQNGGSWRAGVLGPGRYPWRIVASGRTAGNLMTAEC